MCAPTHDAPPTLIAADATWTLWAVILCGVATSVWLERRFRWAKRLSGPVIGLLIAMTLSTTGVMPTSATVYDVVADYLIPVAIPLLLFRADLARIVRVCGRMFAAFHIAVAGTVAGAFVATMLMHGQLEHPAEIGGIMTASYSGGGVNFAAVKDTYRDIVHDETTNPLLVADNFVMAGLFLVLLVLSGSRFLQRHFSHPVIDETEASRVGPRQPSRPTDDREGVGLRDVATALAIAFVIAAVANSIATVLRDGLSKGPDSSPLLSALLGNRYVWTTMLSLTAATLFGRWLGEVQGAELLGGYALYIYLFVIGLPANRAVRRCGAECPGQFRHRAATPAIGSSRRRPLRACRRIPVCRHRPAGRLRHR